MMSDTTIASMIAALVGMLGYCITVFLYVHTRVSSVAEKIDLRLAASEEKSAKGRHDLANQVMQITGKIENRLSVLERETVRESDLKDMDSRHLSHMKEMEVRITSGFAEFKADMKQFIAGMTGEMKALVRTVDRIDPRSTAEQAAHDKAK